MLSPYVGFVALTVNEAATLAAIFRVMWPSDSVGADAVSLGALNYLDRALDGHDRIDLDLYRRTLSLFNAASARQHGVHFREADLEAQREMISALESASLPRMSASLQTRLFSMLRRHLIEGVLSDPAHGGNRQGDGWRSLGYPGVFFEHSAEENSGQAAALKNGSLRTLALHEESFDGVDHQELEIAGFDPERGCEEPTSDCDVIVVGAGAVGALVAPWLALSGLKVVALEAGAWRDPAVCKPDELSLAFYARAGFSQKFATESPRWRKHSGAETEPMSYSLGRMCNGVGGSLAHYGARLRRLHPHHFRMRSTIEEIGRSKLLPEGCTLVDWPVSYAELEPHYAALENGIGVAGPDTSPFVPRSTTLPMPAARPPACGVLFSEATRARGLHPQMIPIGQNTVAFDGRPAMTYSPWGEGLGSASTDRWMPTQDLLLQALNSGNLDLRTRCSVIRVLTGADGRASGVEYADPDGRLRTQSAPIVILAAYTFETVRLLFLSADERRGAGLGNNSGQLGKHFMTKQYPSVFGHYPDRIFNRHTGPGAQGVMVEDYLSANSLPAGFVGGGTLSTENQLLPIQIGFEALPPDVASFGSPWKRHLADWNHRAAIRIQTDTLSYHSNYLDLDPRHRDRSGFGAPLLRVTYDVQTHERGLYQWMLGAAEDIQRAMGAKKIWRGPWFTGVGSCHDFGDSRMGNDPSNSVVNANLEVHDTPGLYVMSGAVFPTCHGVNPTLTLWALCRRATETLVQSVQ
jgi:gluconate 2-dehydrogenase alpha chain